jgi:hypothetical protein
MQKKPIPKKYRERQSDFASVRINIKTRTSNSKVFLWYFENKIDGMLRTGLAL